MPKLKINPITGKLDLMGVDNAGDTMTGALTTTTLTTSDTGESTFNGAVRFNAELIIKAGQKIIFDGA